MYWEWTTLQDGLTNPSERSSVLTSLPSNSAQDVVSSVVKHVVSSLGISQPPSPSNFDTEASVEWCLQVCCPCLIVIIY